jgi:hypothetical protein
MFVAQFAPLKPAAHTQEYPFTRSEQVAPFRQGDETHSSMFVAQFAPL